MEVTGNDMETFEKNMGELPILPPKPTIAFRCKECECVWTFGIESVVSFERFYDKNKDCPNCGKGNIEMDIIPIPSTYREP